MAIVIPSSDSVRIVSSDDFIGSSQVRGVVVGVIRLIADVLRMLGVGHSLTKIGTLGS
jgi:hypothetical protein